MTYGRFGMSPEAGVNELCQAARSMAGSQPVPVSNSAAFTAISPFLSVAMVGGCAAHPQLHCEISGQTGSVARLVAKVATSALTAYALSAKDCPV
jgi:hypothetical protein